MGETPYDIRYDLRSEVELARARLGQDLNRLEYRFRKALDWREQFDRHPALFSGIAFGLAFLIGLALAPRRKRSAATAPPAAR
jgi:hypothetical protein